jgi:hypothetical protein
MATMHKVEIVVHVDDVLGEAEQAELVSDLKKHSGVEQAHFTPGRAHLLVIDYDRDQTSAQDVLEQVKRDNLRAELVGPM